MRLRSPVVLALCAIAAGVPVASAHASEPMSDSNAKLQSLAVNSKGEALVTYRRTDGKVRRVLVWGRRQLGDLRRAVVAAGALPVRLRRRLGQVPQGELLVDVQEPLRAVRRSAARVPRRAAARRPTAPTGRIQSWQRLQPLLGFDPWLPEHTAYELHLSHWSSELAEDRGLTPTGRTAASGRASSGASRTSASRSSGSARRRRAIRRTATGGTSTSTRSTRPTGRAGSVSRESSCTSRTAPSVTASSPRSRSRGTRARRCARRHPASGTGSR